MPLACIHRYVWKPSIFSSHFNSNENHYWEFSFGLICYLWFVFQKELAKLITLEQGKTLADAEGDVFRGLRKSYVAYIDLVNTVITPKLYGSHAGKGYLQNDTTPKEFIKSLGFSLAVYTSCAFTLRTLVSFLQRWWSTPVVSPHLCWARHSPPSLKTWIHTHTGCPLVCVPASPHSTSLPWFPCGCSRWAWCVETLTWWSLQRESLVVPWCWPSYCRTLALQTERWTSSTDSMQVKKKNEVLDGL